MESNENIKYQEISKEDIIKTHDRKQSSNILYADLSGYGAQVQLRDGEPDLEAAEKLLLANGYKITPPTKPLTFEDVVPMTEAPPEGTEYWVVSLSEPDGVFSAWSYNDDYDYPYIKRRIAYLDKEHALIAARHIFGLKGGEL